MALPIIPKLAVTNPTTGNTKDAVPAKRRPLAKP